MTGLSIGIPLKAELAVKRIVHCPRRETLQAADSLSQVEAEAYPCFIGSMDMWV